MFLEPFRQRIWQSHFPDSKIILASTATKRNMTKHTFEIVTFAFKDHDFAVVINNNGGDRAEITFFTFVDTFLPWCQVGSTEYLYSISNKANVYPRSPGTWSTDLIISHKLSVFNIDRLWILRVGNFDAHRYFYWMSVLLTLFPFRFSWTKCHSKLYWIQNSRN